MKPRSKLLFFGLIGSILFMGLSTPSHASPVVVNNFSFEAPLLPEGSQTDNAVLDWVVFDTVVPFQAGVYRPLPLDFNFIPDGEQVAVLSDQSNIRQELGVTFQEGFTYELSVWVGQAFDIHFGGSFVGLYVVGDPIPLAAILNDTDVFLPGEGNWEQQFVSYTYNPADIGLVGLPLEIRLAAVLRSGTTYFDGVQLTAIPEPASLSLTVGVLLGLTGWGWSCRRRAKVMSA